MTVDEQMIPVPYGIGPMLYGGVYRGQPWPGISTTLVNELRLAGFPDLEQGKIQFGTAALNARGATPRVVAIWDGSGATGAEYGAEAVFSNPVFSATKRTSPVLNSLATDLMRIAYHCWAAAHPPDPDQVRDADACRYLVHQLWRVIHKCGVEGSYKVLGIEVPVQATTDLGFQATLVVEHRCPVPDNLEVYALPGLKSTIAVNGAGAPEPPILIPTPPVH